MYAEYDEPKTGAEMIARYAQIRRNLYTNRGSHGIPKTAEVIIFREANAHVADWLQWKLAREAGLSRTETQALYDAHKSVVPVEQIIHEEAERFGLRYEDIIGKRRMREIVMARQAAMARAYVERPDLSLPQIGRLFGGKDHTTVLHAAKKMGVHVPCVVGSSGRQGN